MAWYRTGTVTVTNGSANVTGAGTNFVSNTQQGEGFLGPDGRVYEIASVTSATGLVLASAYQGATAGGQGYALLPTSSFARDLALNAAALLNTFGAVRDSIGQGMIADGSAAVPGIRFAADQDTGLRRVGENAFALVCGGVDRLTCATDGSIGVGTAAPISRLHVNTAGSVAGYATVGNANGAVSLGVQADGTATLANYLAGPLVFGRGISTGYTEAARFDGSNNLLVGTTAAIAGGHVIARSAGEGAALLALNSPATGVNALIAYAVAQQAWSGAATAINVGRNSGTGRSINAGGTINASGADYAEYMTKADGCSPIAAGDVCGVDIDGKLTRTWSAAISFVIKSTDPAYVGGDSWAAHLPPRPDEPGAEPSEPAAPPAAPDTDDAELLDQWRAIIGAYPAQLAAYRTAQAEWEEAVAAYQTDIAGWEAALEAARQCVDRIAFAGQVPVNISGTFAVGDYLIAAANGGGIQAVAVPEAEITFAQYRRRLGKVWAIRDGRPWVDVQHG